MIGVIHINSINFFSKALNHDTGKMIKTCMTCSMYGKTSTDNNHRSHSAFYKMTNSKKHYAVSPCSWLLTQSGVMWVLGWGWFALIQPMCMSFLSRTVTHSEVPESDWHLLQQLVSVGFKFHILLDFLYTFLKQIIHKLYENLLRHKEKYYHLDKYGVSNFYFSWSKMMLRLSACVTKSIKLTDHH